MSLFKSLKDLFLSSKNKEELPDYKTVLTNPLEMLEEKELPNVMTKEWIIKDKTSIEAGYVNNPDDLGGETNHGITKAVATKHYKSLRNIFNWNGDMKSLTTEMAYYIYVLDFWNVLRLDDIIKIDPTLADKLFDIGINTGTGRAGKWLQTFLNVMNNKGALYPDIAVDGSVGPLTVETLKTYVAKRGSRAIPRLLLGLICMQTEHYISISVSREDNETFTYGWLSRAEHNLSYYYERLKR